MGIEVLLLANASAFYRLVFYIADGFWSQVSKGTIHFTLKQQITFFGHEISCLHQELIDLGNTKMLECLGLFDTL